MRHEGIRAALRDRPASTSPPSRPREQRRIPFRRSRQYFCHAFPERYQHRDVDEGATASRRRHIRRSSFLRPGGERPARDGGARCNCRRRLGSRRIVGNRPRALRARRKADGTLTGRCTKVRIACHRCSCRGGEHLRNMVSIFGRDRNRETATVIAGHAVPAAPPPHPETRPETVVNARSCDGSGAVAVRDSVWRESYARNRPVCGATPPAARRAASGARGPSSIAMARVWHAGTRSSLRWAPLSRQGQAQNTMVASSPVALSRSSVGAP